MHYRVVWTQFRQALNFKPDYVEAFYNRGVTLQELTRFEKALASVLEGVTSLLVVHRPSTLALADRVALIDGGRVAAVGRHTELMHTNELYRALLSQEYEGSEIPAGAPTSYSWGG